MAKYEVLQKSFIGVHLVEAGAEIEYDGYPGPNLKPLDDEAREQAAKAAEAAKEAEARLIAATKPIGSQSAEAMGEVVAAAVAKALAQVLAPKGKSGGAPA